MITIGYHLNLNFGDLLNIYLFHIYLGGKVKYKLIPWHMIGSDEKEVYLGIGTLPDLHLPYEWFLDRKVTLLGTGTRYFGNKWEDLNLRGFTRGKLSEQKLGLPGLGDLGLLLDRVYPKPNTKTDDTLVELDHLLLAQDAQMPELPLPNPACFPGVRGTVTLGTAGVYRFIASSRYVVADRLHYAVAAESAQVPWVLYDHGRCGLSAVPRKFEDWASTIGKERFIITDIADIGIIEENTDFEASAKQKDVLEEALYEAISG